MADRSCDICGIHHALHSYHTISTSNKVEMPVLQTPVCNTVQSTCSLHESGWILILSFSQCQSNHQLGRSLRTCTDLTQGH